MPDYTSTHAQTTNHGFLTVFNFVTLLVLCCDSNTKHVDIQYYPLINLQKNTSADCSKLTNDISLKSAFLTLGGNGSM